MGNSDLIVGAISRKLYAPVRIFQPTLHHQIESQLADDVIIGAVIRLALNDFDDMLLGGSHVSLREGLIAECFVADNLFEACI